ncbi:MAG: nucleotidyltransferase domain-containing protein [Gemmatimonadaceae bacterium]|nr:nucleotidyltransferase domain-containing protein [Gloeobacterales cyanobacterium ES-bin-141]
MKLLTPEITKRLSVDIPRQIPCLKLLVLFGSQVKETAHAQSDWDLAILAADGIDETLGDWGEFALYEKLGCLLQIPSDRIDIVNLKHCSPLLGYIVAREGRVLYEAGQDFLDFQLRAWKIYADTVKLRSYTQEYLRQELERLGK